MQCNVGGALHYFYILGLVTIRGSKFRDLKPEAEKIEGNK